MAQTVKPVQLNQRTLEAFDAYIRNAETEMEQTLHGDAPFLWSQQSPKRAQDVRQGKVVAQFWSGRGPVKVASGLIHDWIAAAFIPDSTIQEVFAVIQDYDNHMKMRNFDGHLAAGSDSQLVTVHDSISWPFRSPRT